ncbi:MAG: family 43 glycosylhydrolase [Candidatus Ornithomonoglobus sp.]
MSFTKKRAILLLTAAAMLSSAAAAFAEGYEPDADGVVFPAAVADDTFGTTMAAHDPSIFKDPATGVYYAYNTNAYEGEYETKNGQTLTDTYPMDTFKSDDLIHWERIDNNFRIPQSALDFCKEIFEPMGSAANTGVWAPDIYYAKEDKEHPYWLYYSLSTNGSDFDFIRSMIGLVKGSSPTGPWIDCGVIISSDETDCNTNAIDQNIYEDTNGDRFFLWGSFQKGIHQVKLTADGRAEGVDYTSNKSIHASSKKLGSRLYATPGGVNGPEGAYMISNTDTNYRYMFTSYGWLGTNYNIRAARNSLDNTWASETEASSHRKLVDHNGNLVGTSFVEQTDKSVFWGYKMLGSYQLGDGITYYGNGHCSVFRDDDGEWYLVEHCREVPDGYAKLSVRKMLWNEDGWPVVSPLDYAGEKLQAIPENALYGAWDLASVGVTLMAEGINDLSSWDSSQKCDLPVLSSEIVIQPGGRLGNNLGTWEFDGNYTIRLNFAVDGNEDNYEFYSVGDTMTMYVLAGYDKDTQSNALVMTGTDQNNITQLARKCSDSYEAEETTISTEAIAITKSRGGNPIAGFDADGNTAYGGDPSVLVDGGTVYLYVGHDTAKGDGYVIPEYLCYSSKDLSDWKYEGVAFVCSRENVPWASTDDSAWAAQVLKHNGRYYLYYCTWASMETAEGYQCIGVAVSDTPAGPFKNVSDTPLINGLTDTTENTSAWNDIDPTGWIETDENGAEHIYLNWGNSINYTCELNDDMISVKDISGDGKITSDDIITNKINGLDGAYTEAPWLYKRDGSYYLFFAKDWREQWAYAVTDDLLSGEWEYGGLITPPTATSNTSHGGVFDFNGSTYFIYHNGALPGGSGFRRVANIGELFFNTDGSVKPMKETSVGISGAASVIKNNGIAVSYEGFDNPLTDDSYPLSAEVLCSESGIAGRCSQWEIVQGVSNKSDETLVSIQAVNKPGLYITNDNGAVRLTQLTAADGRTLRKAAFRTVNALDGSDGISFESASRPGTFLAVQDGALTMSGGENPAACSFNISVTSVIADAQLSDGGVNVRLGGLPAGTITAAAYKDGALVSVGSAAAAADTFIKLDTTACDTVKVYTVGDVFTINFK